MHVFKYEGEKTHLHGHINLQLLCPPFLCRGKQRSRPVLVALISNVPEFGADATSKIFRSQPC